MKHKSIFTGIVCIGVIIAFILYFSQKVPATKKSIV